MSKIRKRNFWLLPFVPFLTAFVAVVKALEDDSISQFFPTLWDTWKTWTLEGLARNSFWPEAGWCWRCEGHWTEHERKFVLHDPVKAGKLGWSWSDYVSDHEWAAKELAKAEAATKEQKK
jgi:hypothetical protein